MKRRQKKSTPANKTHNDAAGRDEQRSTLNVQPRLDQALNHLLAGRWGEAEKLYREILATNPRQPDALHFLGVIAHQTGYPEEAMNWISKAIAARPDFAEAHNNLGLVFQGLDQMDKAESSYRRALAVNPNLSESHNNLGNVLRQKGALADAVSCFRKALASKPDYFQACNNLGNALLDQGQTEAAIAQYEKAIAMQPRFAEAHRNLGNVFKQMGRRDQAIRSYQTFIQIQPEALETYCVLGGLLRSQGRLKEAAEQLKRGLVLQPNHAEILALLGLLYLDLKHWHEAAACLQKVLQVHPEHPQALSNLGIAYQELGRLEDAVVCLQKAAHIQPRLGAAFSNWGLALQKLGRHGEAVEQLQRALEIDPNDCGSLANLGFVHQELGQTDVALELYHRALALDPNFAEAHFGKGLAHLLLGDFTTGWQQYEWRWKKMDFTPHGRPEPLWDGSDLQGKSILLHCEQGFGDSIQFIRFAPLLQRRGARVVVLCPQPLEKLFQSAEGVDFVTSCVENLWPCAFQVPLMSLPGLLGIQLDTLPARVPYLFARANHNRFLNEAGGRIRIGLVWRGNPGHKNDRNRSIDVQHLLSLLAMDGCLFYGFQRDVRQEEREMLEKHDNFIDLGPRLNDFSDTAAALAELDLVLAVDTALVHVAGAMAKPTWVMLPFVPDWRWLLGRQDSPWYPTVRLFRQKKPGDWQGVVEHVKTELHRIHASEK